MKEKFSLKQYYTERKDSKQAIMLEEQEKNQPKINI